MTDYDLDLGQDVRSAKNVESKYVHIHCVFAFNKSRILLSWPPPPLILLCV